MLLASNKEWIAEARHLSVQARELEVHYEHKVVGFNYRMSNVLAGLGKSQFSDLGRRISVRRKHFEAYSLAFEARYEIEMMPIAEPDGCNYWLSCLTLHESLGPNARDALVRALEAEDIEARPLWKPMHLQPVFKGKPSFGGGVSADLFARGICLPSGSGMSKSDRFRVIEHVLDFVSGGPY